MEIYAGKYRVETNNTLILINQYQTATQRLEARKVPVESAQSMKNRPLAPYQTIKKLIYCST
jgi:hypothetical protein